MTDSHEATCREWEVMHDALMRIAERSELWVSRLAYPGSSPIEELHSVAVAALAHVDAIDTAVGRAS